MKFTGRRVPFPANPVKRFIGGGDALFSSGALWACPIRCVRQLEMCYATLFEHINRPPQRFPSPPQIRCLYYLAPAAARSPHLDRPDDHLPRFPQHTTVTLHICPSHPGCLRVRPPPIPALARFLHSDNVFRSRSRVSPTASKYSFSGSCRQ